MEPWGLLFWANTPALSSFLNPPPLFLSFVSFVGIAIWVVSCLILLFLLLCLLLLVPLPPALRPVYMPAIIGRGALSPQPPNLSLLVKHDHSTRSGCSSCPSSSSSSSSSSAATAGRLGYLLRLSGLLKPWHLQHQQRVLRQLSPRPPSLQLSNEVSPQLSPSDAPGPVSPSLLGLSTLCLVERFGSAEQMSAAAGAAAADELQQHPTLQKEQEEQRAPLRTPASEAASLATAAASPAPGAAATETTAVSAASAAAAGNGGMSQCPSCRLSASWLHMPSLSRQELLQCCPSLLRGFRPDSLLLRHRLVQGLLLYLQEATRAVKLMDFDRRFWVPSADGDVVLVHYYRHRTSLSACRESWASTAAAAAALGGAAGGGEPEAVGCTDGRFRHGRPHGLCGCRGILFVVGGIGAKAHDLQVQHVALLAAAKGFCVYFLSCLRGIEAPITVLPTDLTASADAQAALAFILHMHVHGFKPIQKQQQQHQQEEQQPQASLALEEASETFTRMVMEGSVETFLNSIPEGLVPPVFLLGYSMGSCAVLRMLGSLGLQQALRQLQQQQKQQEKGKQQQQQQQQKQEQKQQDGGTEQPSLQHQEQQQEQPRDHGRRAHRRGSGSRSRSSSSSSSSSNARLSPFCLDLSAAVASESLPSLAWLRFVKGAVTVSNAMCLDSCIASLDGARCLTGYLIQRSMLQMYKTKQWLEPQHKYIERGLDPGIIALSQMTKTIREIDMLTHLSVCCTPSSPLSCSSVYYSLASCLSHTLLVPVPFLCLHALDDPIVLPLAVCKAAATVPKYNTNCTYAVISKGGHNLFQEGFWSIIGASISRVFSLLYLRLCNCIFNGTGCYPAQSLPRSLFSFLSGGKKHGGRQTGKEAESATTAKTRTEGDRSKQGAEGGGVPNLFLEENFQARLIMEYITAVWRRC